MGKYKPSPDRGYKRKERALRKNTIVFFTTFFTLAIAGLMLVAATKKWAQTIDGSMRVSKTAEFPPNNDMVVKKILSSLETNEFSGGLQPVMIYTKTADKSEEYFIGMGTLVDKGNDTFHLVTSEHILSKSFSSREYLRIAAMKGALFGKKFYVSKIIRTRKELGGADVMITEVGEVPVPLEAFSDYLAHQQGKIVWQKPRSKGVEVKVVQSILSRKIIEIIGFGAIDQHKGQNLIIVIDAHADPGESGTGFIDEVGSLWVLHGSSDPEEEQRMLHFYHVETGKKASGACLLSGPIFRNY